MTTLSVPSNDRANFSKWCAAALVASGELSGAVVRMLHADKQAALDGLLKGGGAVGIEALADGAGTTRLFLVGIEREGARRVLVEIPPAGA